MRRKGLFSILSVALCSIMVVALAQAQQYGQAPQWQSEERGFHGLEIPEIEFWVEPVRIEPGMPVHVGWNAEWAEEVRLWKSPVLPFAAEPLDWVRILELGEPVDRAGEMELMPEETTAFYLVARSFAGMRARRFIVEVVTERFEQTAELWRPAELYLGKMEDRSHVGWLQSTVDLRRIDSARFESWMRMGEMWSGKSSPPGISLTLMPQVIFVGESTLLSWNISNANCADKSVTQYFTSLKAQAGAISGTVPAGGGFGAGGMPVCALSKWMSGSENISGMPFGPRNEWHHFNAKNALGKSATTSRWIDVLSVPQFKGNSTPKRIAAIKKAIKTIDKKLRDGCIYNDTGLDKTVAAFKDGHIDRRAFWARLLAELQNLKLVTFNCKDVSDKNWGAGHWADYTNEIILEWSPSHTPYLEYVILHELIHKCGFNGNLLKYYAKYTKSPNETGVENQAHKVTGACIP